MSLVEGHTPDTRRIAEAFVERVREAAPEQVRGAARVLDRLPPARWTLEWFLPWWLGDTFGVDRDITDDIVLGNLFGLAFVRIHDDLVDGELGADPDGDVAADGDGGAAAGAEALAALMYDEAIGAYRRRFGPMSQVWDRLERYVAEWRSTTLTAGPASDRTVARDGPDVERLAMRGAPLKIGAFAVCELGGTLGRFAEIERALDHALTALVAYDHLCDWEADIAAGRWNAFVAANSTLPQPAENADRLRAAMFVTLLTGDAVAAWSARIAGELAAAIAAVDRLGIARLDEHLCDYAARTAQQGAMLQRRYHDAAKLAGSLLAGRWEVPLR